MPDPAPIHLSKCDEELPLSAITRQFDFGQFLLLRQLPDPELPTVTPFEKAPVPIVVDPSGGFVQAYQDWLERTGARGPADVWRTRPELDPAPLGGVSLTKILKGNPADEGPTEIEVKGAHVKAAIETGEIPYDGKNLKLAFDSAGRELFVTGRPAIAMASDPDGGGWFVTELKPEVETKQLTAQELDATISNQELRVNGSVRKVDLNATGISALLSGQPALVTLRDTIGRAIRLVPPKREVEPAAPAMEVVDLPRFLTNPEIPGAEGESIPLTLKAADVRRLRTEGSATVYVGKAPVILRQGEAAGVGSYGLRATADPGGPDGGYPPTNGGGAHPATPVPPGMPLPPPPPVVVVPGIPLDRRPQPAPPPGRGQPGPEPAEPPKIKVKGLQVAVFMPWRQTWRLTGFSRGELRYSLALAPQEETVIEVATWQRRARTLDQSSSAEIEQAFESTQAEKETDDVFKELTTRHDFNWQVDGSVDATYNPVWGSVHVTAGGGLSSSQQLQQIARNTQQRIRESTQKSAAKVRSTRTTRITDSVETGGQDRVTRRIQNPNLSRTLTLDFFETLAHYEVGLQPLPDRLGLVALFPNPMATKDFGEHLVRRNESALRRALLDAALEEGFAACRRIEAYEYAKRLVAEQAEQAKRTEVTDREGAVKKPEPTKTIPQETAVLQLLAQIAAAATNTRANENVTVALTKINADQSSNPVTPTDRRNAQYWLFRRMLGKYLPTVLKALDDLPANPGIEHAQPYLAVVPQVGSALTIAGLNEKSDVDKEQSGLGPEIARIVGGFLKWPWSTGRCKEEGLYTVNDAGIAGLTAELQKAFVEWQLKRSEGELKEEVEVTIARANADQDKLSTEDKLAMAFPLDELSAAYERRDALLKHLNEHPEHYSFALFQGLSPAEQNMHIERSSGGALEVGMFEPRVIAINGPDLAVPLTPPPEGELRTMLENIRSSFAEAFQDTADRPETFVFPTAGLTINSRLGRCSAVEEYIEESRRIQLRRLAAEARSVELEAARRAARVKAGDLADPEVDAPPIRVSLDQGD
jgi:hypothetical protein